jgi:hypothetical protein
VLNVVSLKLEEAETIVAAWLQRYSLHEKLGPLVLFTTPFTGFVQNPKLKEDDMYA